MSTDLIMQFMDGLKISDPLTLGEILHAKGVYSSVHSARVQAQKALNSLVELKRVERGQGYYRVLGCEGEYGDHARLLTKTLAALYSHADPVIFREHTISELSLRPDAIVLLKRDGSGLCFFLEACLTETPAYLNQKITALRNWGGALNYLSDLFNCHVPHFDIVVCSPPDELPAGVWEFNRFLKEVVK